MAELERMICGQMGTVWNGTASCQNIHSPPSISFSAAGFPLTNQSSYFFPIFFEGINKMFVLCGVQCYAHCPWTQNKKQQLRW
jgi:hypothetical protein